MRVEQGRIRWKKEGKGTARGLWSDMSTRPASILSRLRLVDLERQCRSERELELRRCCRYVDDCAGVGHGRNG